MMAAPVTVGTGPGAFPGGEIRGQVREEVADVGGGCIHAG
jgi:hypothetical protein